MASLFAALTVAVGGLDAQSSALGNISDNLSNSQTTGFKSIGTNFESLVTQSNANINDPGGVHNATPEYQNDVQGNLTQSATTATNLAISGQGFFQVEPATQNANGSTTFSGNVAYTRQGDFTLDKDGFIVNSSGYYLMGYAVDSSGNVDTSTTAPIEVSALLNDPVPSTTATYDANLPSSAATNFASTSSTVQLFDALGNTHDMSFTWTKVGTNSWDLNVTVKAGAGYECILAVRIWITPPRSPFPSTVPAVTSAPSAISARQPRAARAAPIRLSIIQTRLKMRRKFRSI